MSSSPSLLTRRHLLQGGLALGADSLAPQLPAFAQTAEPRLLTAGPGEAQLLPSGQQIGRAHVCTPVTNAHLVCRLLLEKKNNTVYNHVSPSHVSHNELI